ncbi:MAG: molybdopterin-guanine dinucleotide biosynthesis protein B [Anaerolineae bacterium]
MTIPPVISFVGKSDSGKTTLLEKVIRELKRRGYRVGTIKHDAHDFEMDHAGTDTWRHAQAGSDHVIISSPHKVASIRKVEQEASLWELAATMTDVDIILTEGYKRGPAPKIEVSRRERSAELICSPAELIAVVSNQHFDIPVPQFDLDDAAGVVDLIVERFLTPVPVSPYQAESLPLVP